MLRSFAILCVLTLGAGCAMSEPVGDDQSAVSGTAATGGSTVMEGSGGAATGGAAGAAGASEGGGAGDTPTAAGGAAGAGSGGDTGGAAGSPPSCEAGEKLCESGCAEIAPEVGCGSLACVPCKSPPANAKGICNGALCDFECLPGFVQQGFACVSQGGGGTGGTGGSSGSGGAGASGGTGGTGGGASLCVAPCTPSDPKAQFLCAAACALSGGFGLCAPALNCCVCS